MIQSGYMRLISVTLDKLPDKGALANAGLAPEQDDLSPGRLGIHEQIGHQLEFSISLQEHVPQATWGALGG